MKKANYILGGVLFLVGLFMLLSIPMAKADTAVDQTASNVQNAQNVKTVKKAHKKARRHKHQKKPVGSVTGNQTK